ncbi:MAG: hypothetical protein ABIF06_01180 [bacterium]
MPKNIEDIIIPDKRKSIRDVPIPDGRGRNSISGHTGKKVEVDSMVMSQTRSTAPEVKPTSYKDKYRNLNTRRTFSKSVWVSAIIAILVAVFAVLSLFRGGTLAYMPKFVALSFDRDAYVATKTGDGGLLYSVVKLSADKSGTVSASGQEEVSRKASGTIVVYNDASTASQQLVEKTRFEAVNGKVYRIDKNVTIPGKKIVNGQSQPGSLEVTVYADEAGDTYNQGLTDFTIPGFKGSSKYKTIYARSKTAMTGGFVGLAPKISDENLAKARTELRIALESGLMNEARAQVPDDFILISALSSITYDDLPETGSEKNSATVNVRGNLYGVMFKKSDLSKQLGMKKTTLSPEDNVTMETFETLTFVFSGTAPTDLLTSDQIKFEVTGNANLVWNTDENALRADLVGRGKKDVQSIVNNYPGIKTADVTIRPFWKGSFPDELTKITIKRLPLQ